MKKYLLVTLVSFFSLATFADTLSTKEAAIVQLRSHLALPLKESFIDQKDSLYQLLDNQGRFIDLRSAEDESFSKKYATSHSMSHCIFINNVTSVALDRLNRMTLDYRRGNHFDLQNDTLVTIFKSINFYGHLETARRDSTRGRFHASCFAIPKAACSIYFSLLPLMDKVETNACNLPLLTDVNFYLKKVGFQSWTQPFRLDETDKNVISVERFRKHVWWVGGNALCYRPLLDAAIMKSSVPMVDVLAEVVSRSFSFVSQTTYDESFWIEGITADGAGWGHGKQCLVWGYPIDGMKGAFRILRLLKNTPWSQALSSSAIDVILHYIRSSAFYHYKGVTPPVLDRANMMRRPNYVGSIPSSSLASILLNEWSDFLSTAQKDELSQFVKESSAHDILMKNYPNGDYHGIRYFYNNDDMIKKTPDYYVFVNMGSYRVDGLESAYPGASGFNFYTADGVTLFQKTGLEYRNVLGAMRLTAWPGITTRQTPVELKPLVNWSGFVSSHNYAAGASDDKDNFVAGFIYNKINAGDKYHGRNNTNDKFQPIYGVQAYKGYFMFDDLFLALGAGITNDSTNLEGTITTTLEQTFSTAAPVYKNKYDWVRHGSFAYKVLPRYTTGKVNIISEQRKTNWARLCKRNVQDEENVRVFQMEIDHGKDVKDGTYAYLVNCTPNLPKKLPTILSNTTSLQAVENAEKDALGIILYDSAEHVISSSLGDFKVATPAAILIQKEEDGRLRVTVADPLQDVTLSKYTIQTTLKVDGKNVKRRSKKWSELTLDMPVEPHRGRPVTYYFSLK